ncbi:MAG: hypothetical protein CR974_02715 [Gammaproteobacteria bacterium]|nr:MAG: hypothetical protein CR974_02715 [Gammaproteobacteria bacterium]
MSVSLASNAEFAQRGVSRSDILNQLNFTLIERRGRIFVKVSSRKRITAPYLNFILRLSTPEGIVSREYAIFLDPPGKSKKKSVNSAGGQGKPYRPAVAKPTARSNQRSTAARSASAPSSTAGAGRYGPIRNGETLWSIANHTRPAGVSVRAMLKAIKRANRRKLSRGLMTGSYLVIPTFDGQPAYNGGYAPMPPSVAKQKARKKQARKTRKSKVAAQKARKRYNKNKRKRNTQQRKKHTQRNVKKQTAMRPQVAKKAPAVPAVTDLPKPTLPTPDTGDVSVPDVLPPAIIPPAETVPNATENGGVAAIEPAAPSVVAQQKSPKVPDPAGVAMADVPQPDVPPVAVAPELAGAGSGVGDTVGAEDDISDLLNAETGGIPIDPVTGEVKVPPVDVGDGLAAEVAQPPVKAKTPAVPATDVTADGSVTPKADAAMPPPVEDKPAVLEQPTAQANDKPAAKPSKPKPVKKQPEPTIVDQLMDNAPLIGGGVGGIAALGGLAWFALRRRKQKQDTPVLTEESMPVLLGEDDDFDELNDLSEWDDDDSDDLDELNDLDELGDFDDELDDSLEDDSPAIPGLGVFSPQTDDGGDVLEVNGDNDDLLADDDFDMDFDDGMADMDFDADAGTDVEASDDIAAVEAPEEEDTSLDFSFGDDVFDFDEETTDSADEASGIAADDSASLDFDTDEDADTSLDFSFDDDDALPEASAVEKADEPLDDFEDFSFESLQSSMSDEPVSAADSSAGDNLDLSFDLSKDEPASSDDAMSLDFSLDELSMADSDDKPALDLNVNESAEPSAEIVSSMQMKLDLANSFLSIGQEGRARDLLEEIASKGSEEQVEKAKSLLETID